MKRFFIKEGYKVNLTVNQKPVEIYKIPPMSKLYQVPVYKRIKELLREKPGLHVLELGSGTGYKLNKYVHPYAKSTTGADQEICINYAQIKFKRIRWEVVDLEEIPKKLNENGFDIIISADVIEHLVDPDKLLEWCRINANKTSKIFLSTPERDLVRGSEDMGPPANKLHIREWNYLEFKAYLEASGFIIDSHEIMPDRIKNWRDWLFGGSTSKTCQLVICRV